MLKAAAALGQDLEHSRHDDETEAWAQTDYAAKRGEFAAVARLRDAQRLFNLNALAFQPPLAAGAAADDDAPALSAQQIAIARFTLLLQALQLPPELLPALLDWLDADSDTRFPNGAEDEYYTRLEEPYRAADGPFADVSELRLVRGMTPEIYARLAPHVCVLGHSVPLNINTAPAEVLMSLGPGIDRATADLLVGSREIQPWTDIASFLDHPLLAGRRLLAHGLGTRSNWFELRTRVDGSAGALFRRTLIERLAPNRLRVARRERRYVDG